MFLIIHTSIPDFLLSPHILWTIKETETGSFGQRFTVMGGEEGKVVNDSLCPFLGLDFLGKLNP